MIRFQRLSEADGRAASVLAGRAALHSAVNDASMLSVLAGLLTLVRGPQLHHLR